MSIKSREELLNGAKAIFGDSETDEVLEFLGDITDTLDDYENKVNDKEDWQTKYEENDSNWRKKYKERFFSSNDPKPGDPKPGDPLDYMNEPNEPEPPKNFSDLFKTE